MNTSTPPVAITAPDDARSLAGKRILLAEDGAVNRLLITRLLERLGCNVVVATNGIEAVTAMLDQVFDVVLMDCQMPEMDGLQATAVIRGHHGPCRDVPIVALTASMAEEDKQRCLDVGMNDFLSKPMGGPALEGALRRTLDKVPVAAAPADPALADYGSSASSMSD